MASIAGYGGNFSYTGTSVDGDITEWSATMDADDITIPAAFDGVWKTHTLGQGRISGSFSGTLATGKYPMIVPISGGWTSTMTVTSLILTCAASSRTITIAEAIFSNVRITRPHNGVATISADFRSTGGAITVGTFS